LKNWIWSGTVGALKSDLYTRRTVFIPKKTKTYKLTVKTAVANSESLKGEIILMGGGWKAP